MAQPYADTRVPLVLPTTWQCPEILMVVDKQVERDEGGSVARTKSNSITKD